MSKAFYVITALILLGVGIYTITFFMNTSTDYANTLIKKEPIPDNAAVATLAGGCFWCIEAAYEGGRPGIYEAVSGYTGGRASDASYRLIAEGDTGHVEAVQVFYDPKLNTYEEILEVFWKQIDPTDDGGQFADRGDHYRTAIFYHDDTQKQIAEVAKKALEDSGKFEEPIVTQILPFTEFYVAEENHQDFAKKASSYYERYKKGSGRTGFIDENWKKDE